MTSLKPLLPSRDRLEMTKEECEEFVRSLKGLESTMRDHLQALAAYVTSSKKDQPITSEFSSKPGQGVAKKQLDPIMKKIMTASTEDMAVVRKEKVTIHVKIVFLKVGEIDTLRDRFAADAYVQAKWREPALDGKQHIPVDHINWDNYWNPKLLIDNIFGDPKETIWHSILYDSSGLAMVSQKRRVNGSFLEYMELNQFPFDTQDLTVSLTSERSNDEIEFVEDVNDKCALNVESFVDEQEWKLHKVIHIWTRTREESFQSVTCFHPVFSAACKASRRPEFFIWNILVVMFLICTLSFATFAVQVHLPQNRLQLSFILLLTTVSFKFVVNQSLPMISYLTYLDKYILSSMAILCCICVWHAVAISIYNKFSESAANVADKYAIGILGSIYFIFHLVFIVSIACLARENLRMTRDKEQEAEKGQTDQSHDYEGVRGTIPMMYYNDVDTRDSSDVFTNQQALTSYQ